MACILLASSAGLGCAGGPPGDLDDACAIFQEKRGWQRVVGNVSQRWGIEPALPLAFIHQESRFQARARPARRRLLGLIPTTRPSSAYGYGQVKDGTWDDYRRATGHRFASRTRFRDVADFIGWYADRIHRLTGVAKDDAYRLYLAYHEGPTGFRRASYRDKQWLLGVARGVEARAQRYASQHARCAG